MSIPAVLSDRYQDETQHHIPHIYSPLNKIKYKKSSEDKDSKL